MREAAPGEDKQDIINEAGKQEIALTLVNRAEGLAQEDSSNMKALFVRYSGISGDTPATCVKYSILNYVFLFTCVQMYLPVMKTGPGVLWCVCMRNCIS